jgi:hypothetical protein
MDRHPLYAACLVTAALTLPLVAAPPALAQSSEDSASQDGDTENEARKHFRLGRAYYDSGEFVQAAEQFQKAYDISGRSELLYNLYLAWNDAGRINEAIDALERYLDEVPNASNRDRLEARLRNLRRLKKRQGAGAEPPPTEEGQADEDAQAADGEQGQPTDPSEQGSEATGGPDPDQDAEEQAAGGQRPPAPGSTESPKGDDAADAADAADATGPSPAPEDEGSAVLPGVVMGVGGAMLVGGAITGALALKAESDLESDCTPDGMGTYSCSSSGFKDTKDRGQKLATATDVLLVGGVLTAGAGLALFFLLDDDAAGESRVSGGLGCTAEGCHGTARVRF